MKLITALLCLFSTVQAYANLQLEKQDYTVNEDGSYTIHNPFLLVKSLHSPFITFDDRDIGGSDADCAIYGLGRHIDYKTKDISYEEAWDKTAAYVSTYPKLEIKVPVYDKQDEAMIDHYTVYTELSCFIPDQRQN